MIPHLQRHLQSYLRERPQEAHPMPTAALAAKMATTTQKTRKALQQLHARGQVHRTKSGRTFLWASADDTTPKETI